MIKNIYVLHHKLVIEPQLINSYSWMCCFYTVCSVWLWSGSEWIFREEWWLPVPAGLPASSRHALQQLWGVCGGSGGHSPGEKLPSRLLCLHHLQVITKIYLRGNVVLLHFRATCLCLCVVVPPSLSLCLRQPFPAGDCVTFSGKERLCQRCSHPVSPAPKNFSRSNSECIL